MHVLNPASVEAPPFGPPKGPKGGISSGSRVRP